MFATKSDRGYINVVEGVKRKTLVHGKNTLMTEFPLERGKICQITATRRNR
jgi:hypothetical protein